ncbi:MAG: YlbF family regulator [Lactobacillales bacterium]|jgi:cell fate (sporulation/competence/biofilm development) regulator YlbF (YheA/YmcA/DUF963 family)|nr:YlbF family regulator [Lactobacillales bacterium]
MIITENLFVIEDVLKELAKAIGNSWQAKKLSLARREVSEDPKILKLEKNLQSAYDEFVCIQKYGSYAPGYNDKKKAFYYAKKVYDLHDSIANLRQSEMAVQTILDEVAVKIAQVVSENIPVDTGNPFFNYKQKKNCAKDCLFS